MKIEYEGTQVFRFFCMFRMHILFLHLSININRTLSVETQKFSTRDYNISWLKVFLLGSKKDRALRPNSIVVDTKHGHFMQTLFLFMKQQENEKMRTFVRLRHSFGMILHRFEILKWTI